MRRAVSSSRPHGVARGSGMPTGQNKLYTQRTITTYFQPSISMSSITETPQKSKNLETQEKLETCINSTKLHQTTILNYLSVHSDNINRPLLSSANSTEFLNPQPYDTPPPDGNSVSGHTSDSSYTRSRDTNVMDRSMAMSSHDASTLGSGNHELALHKPSIQRKITDYIDIVAPRPSPPGFGSGPSSPARIPGKRRGLPRVPPSTNATHTQVQPRLRKYLLRYKVPCSSQTKITQYTRSAPLEDLSDTWGHSLASIDETTTFRIFLQNPNGLALYPTNYSLLQDLHTCRDYGAAVISLPETKVNWDMPGQHSTFRQMLRHTWGSSAYQTSRAKEPFLSNYQPGGTASKEQNALSLSQHTMCALLIIVLVAQQQHTNSNIASFPIFIALIIFRLPHVHTANSY
jgi:hypothetical protein